MLSPLNSCWTLLFAVLIACPAALGQVRSEAFPGVDACAQINAAMQSLPASGGVIDARAYSGAQTCGSNPFIVPAFAGTLMNAVSAGPYNVQITGNAGTGWTTAQTGGALYCTPSTGPVFLGIVGSVASGTSLTLTAGSLGSCNANSTYIITAKSGVLLLGNAVYQASATWIVPDKWRVYGTGRGNVSGALPSSNTVIQAASGFTSQVQSLTANTWNGSTGAVNLSSNPMSTNFVGYLIQQSISGQITTTGTTSPNGTSNCGSGFPTLPSGSGTNFQLYGATVQISDGTFIGLINSVSACSSGSQPFTLQNNATKQYSSFTNANFVGPDQGVVLSQSGTALTLAQTNQPESVSTAQPVTLTPPLVEIGVSANYNPAGFKNAIVQGAGIESLMVNCNSVAGGLGIQTLLGQEESFVSDVAISACLGAGFNIQGSGAQNFGPVSNIDIEPGGSATAQTECIIDTVVAGWRGIHGMTCTGPATATGSGAAVMNTGIDESSEAVTLENIHLESMVTGIEVAAQNTQSPSIASPGQGITLTNINGWTGAAPVTTLVDISNNGHTVVNQAIDVNANGLVLPQGTYILRDNIVGPTGGAGITALTDAAVAKYVLGQTSAGSSSNSNRTRITSSPNATNIYTTPADFTNQPQLTEVANASSTGTTVNTLAKLTGAPSTGVIAATTDTSGVVGVVVSGAGTTGNAQIAVAGQASCIFDGATTAGDYVQTSSTTGGDCHDTGGTLPTSGQVLGRVLSTGSGGKTAMIIFGPSQQASNNGGLNSQTASYTLVSGDGGKIVSFNGSSLTATLPSPPPSSAWKATVQNLSTSSLTVSRNGLLINGGTSNITLTQYQAVTLWTDGTNYFTNTVPTFVSAPVTLTAAANGLTLGLTSEGTGSKVQLTNASGTTSGDLVTYDGNGNVQDSGTLLTSGHILQVSSINAVTPTSTQYMALSGSYGALTTTEKNVQTVMPRGGTMNGLYVNLSAATTSALTFTLRKCTPTGGVCTGSSQLVTCTVAASTQTCNDTAHSFAFAAGDLVDIQTSQTSTTSTEFIQVGVTYY